MRRPSSKRESNCGLTCWEGPWGDNPTEVVYVARESGTYAGTILLARKYSPIVPGRLSIVRRGATFDFNTADYVDTYFTSSAMQWPCPGCPGEGVWYTWYQGRHAYNQPLYFFLPDVHAGDTLRFVYHGSSDIPATSLGHYNFGGDVAMQLFDPCYCSFEEGQLQEKELCIVTFGVSVLPFVGFRVIAERDTVTHGEGTPVRAVAVDSNGAEVQIDSTTMIRYTEVPDTLGSFIEANGDTSSSSGINARYADARAGRIKFVANKSKPDSIRPVMISVVQMSDTTKRGSKTVYISPDTVELELISPDTTGVDTVYISRQPRMPTLIPKARLKNYRAGQVVFDWRFSVKWVKQEVDSAGRPIGDRITFGPVSAKDTVQNSDTSKWTMQWGNVIRGGDIDTLVVSARIGGKTLKKTVTNRYVILGKNPPKDSVKYGLSLQEQVVIYEESSPKWWHFGVDSLPIYGRPHGYGLMQLDPPTSQQIWDWKTNRAGGVQKLADKYRAAQAYARNIRRGKSNPDLYGTTEYANATDLTTQEQLWKEAFHRYRGGSYWRWRPERKKDPLSPGEWRADPQQGHNRGGIDWQYYQDVLNNHFPPLW